MKCPACNLEVEVAKEILPSKWVYARINNLRVKCPLNTSNAVIYNMAEDTANNTGEGFENKAEDDIDNEGEENDEDFSDTDDNCGEDNGEVKNNEKEENNENDDILSGSEKQMLSGHKRKKMFVDDMTNKKRKLNVIKIECGWMGTYGEFKQHQQQCKFRLGICKYCSEFGTFANIQQRNMHEHYKECKYFPIDCNYCGAAIQRRNFDDHVTMQCTKGIVRCEKCGEDFIREEAEEHKEICPREFITCEWYNYGCVAVLERRERDIHNKVQSIEHLHMDKGKIDALQIQLDKLQAENVFLIDHINELERLNRVNLNHSSL